MRNNNNNNPVLVSIGRLAFQVLNSLSTGGTNLNQVNIPEWCGVLAGLSLVWRIIHFVTLRRSMF